jgi:hypothetical protein
MLTLDLENFAIELDDGAVKTIGASNKSADVNLYDVTDVEVREFGDNRVKLAFADDDGNEIEIALFPDEAASVRSGIEALEADSRVFE